MGGTMSNADIKTHTAPDGARHASGVLDRVRAWWRDLPLMRAFFCAAVLWFVASAAVSIVVMELLLGAYDHLDATLLADEVEVEGGPYVYDAQTDELVPAVSVDKDGYDERLVFLGMRGGVGRATESSGQYSQEVIALRGTGHKVVYATMDMLRADDTLSVLDWGANYTEADYAEANGNPYDPVPIGLDELAAYDARERAERAPTNENIARAVGDDPDVLVSNVAYYVSREAEPAPMLALRIAAGFVPFVVGGVLAVVLFRRFYRKRIAEPLSALHDAADKVAAQDLDFTVEMPQGREFGRLAEAFERMRSSLAKVQAELWRTADDRRRLNAAFAHDLRTPVTVLKGTVEMARLRRGAARATGSAVSADDEERTLDAVEEQALRLERYAEAMAAANRLEDREPERLDVALSDVVRRVEAEARALMVAHDDLALTFTGPADVEDAPVLAIDVELLCEVLDNLLTNACAHARTAITVALGYDADEATLTLEVGDDGPGFTDEALRRGTDPFYSEEKSAEHFGMGLNIVQTLARQHDGVVCLRNAAPPQTGARVEVRISVG